MAVQSCANGIRPLASGCPLQAGQGARIVNARVPVQVAVAVAVAVHAQLRVDVDVDVDVHVNLNGDGPA